MNKDAIATNRALLTELNKLRVPDDRFNLTIADENVPDSPFEGCEALRRLHGIVSLLF